MQLNGEKLPMSVHKCLTQIFFICELYNYYCCHQVTVISELFDYYKETLLKSILLI